MRYGEERIRGLEEKAKKLRRDVLEMIGIGLAGHVGGSMSSADMMAALYGHKMRHDPKNPRMPGRDRFLLSKGHVAVLQYAALADAGYFPREELKKCKALGAMLQGHPDVLKTPGIEAGTGSLGQGLSIGLGMALGMRLDNEPVRVYVLMGDGEIAEGQIWESAMAAASFKADNLVGILDKNNLQATGRIKDRMDSGDLRAKWEAFGWHVLEIDGHNMPEILAALDEADGIKGRPTLILMHTVKGKGLSFAEDNAAYHNAPLTEGDYNRAMCELAEQEEGSKWQPRT